VIWDEQSGTVTGFSSSVGIISPMLHIHFLIYITFIRRTSGRSLGTFKHNSSLSDVGGGGGLDSVVVSHEILELICRPSCHWLALDNIRIFGYIKRFKRAEFIGRMGMRYVINR